ncbi:MAG TPA: hypothetical protein VIF88_12485 [Methylocystis sp.]|jgi:hypothetical protein
MNKYSIFIGRLPKGAPQEAFASIAAGWEIHDKTAAQIAAIKSDPNLTSAGKAIAIEKALKAGPLDHLRQLRADVDKRLSDAVSQRGVLRERVLGADNFSKALKQEVRQYLRELQPVERMKVLNSDDALIREAVLGAPHYLSGVPKDVWGHAADAAVEAVHGEHLKQIDVLETAFSETQAALQVALDDIRRASDLPPNEFEKIAA